MKTGMRRYIINAGLAAMLLVGCRSAEQQLHDTSMEIGLPPNTNLLASYIQENQGSQDVCYSTSLLALYGSVLTIKQIAEFYSAALESQGWTKYSPSGLSTQGDNIHLIYRRDRSFQVGLSEATPFEIDQFGDDARDKAQPYDTVYSVTWTYPDAIARQRCPAWQTEPSSQP